MYDWIKAFHVIAVIAWMAGMLYLPRLFVYHCEAPKGSPQSETFKVMERRLLKGIINPAMIATWLLGTYQTSFAIAVYIAVCAVISLIATAMMPDLTGRRIDDVVEKPAVARS
jgi:uncharacterized integral membrane protein (TIGR00701 family)